MEKTDLYKGLIDEVVTCSMCDLGCSELDGRNPHVPGQGNLHSKIMFIAEAPGLQETIYNKPLIPPGTSGKIYENILEFLSLKREDVFTTNVVLCRPPKNRDPEAWEVFKCKKYLDKTLEIVKPKLVVSFGRFAASALVGNIKITKDHGSLIYSDKFEVNVFPLYHPAYVGAYAPKEKRLEFKEDIKKLKNIITEMGIA